MTPYYDRAHGEKSEVGLRDNSNYLRYWTARFFAVLGSQVTYISFPLLALAIAGSTFQASLVTVVTYATPFLVSVPSGYVADHFDRRTLMIATDSCNAIVYAAIGTLVVWDDVNVAFLCVGAFLVAANSSIYRSASTAALPSIVGKDMMRRAVSANESRDFLIALGAPLLGAALFIQNWSLPFYVNGGAFLISAVITVWLRKEVTGSTAERSGRVVQSSLLGLRTVAKDATLAASLGLLGALSFVLTLNFFGVAALFASVGSEFDVGFLLAAQSLGGFVGALAAVKVSRRLGGTRAFVAQGLMWVLTTTSTALFANVWLTAATLTLTWFVTPSMRAIYQAYVAEAVAEELRGRVASASQLISATASPLGVLTAGALGSSVSLRAPFLVGAIVAAVATVIFIVVARFNTLWIVDDGMDESSVKVGEQ